MPQKESDPPPVPPEGYVLGQEIEKQRRIASDPTQPLDVRLEAYEDVFELEVGDTDLVRVRNIERESGVMQLYLKFEGGNPSGTQKDRIAFAQVMDALRRGYDSVTVATCGNYGAAMALACSVAGLRCEAVIPEGYHTRRTREMEKLGADVIRAAGDYEAAVVASQQRAEEKGLYDANPGGANAIIQLQAYGEIAYEIYDELRDAPAAIAVPVSNGSTLAGLYRGFLSLYRRGRTSRMPRFVAGSTYKKNPIVYSFLKGSETCLDLPPGNIRETLINEPLVNWHSIDGDLALAAVRRTEGWAGYGTDKQMKQMARRIREVQGLDVLPASTAGLIALLSRHSEEPLPPDRYVAIITGRNL